MIQYLSQAESEGEKVFSFCRKHYSALTKRQLQQCFSDKIVFVNEIPVRGSLDAARRLRKGDSVKIVWDADVAKKQKVSAITVDVSYQDANIMVIYKPPGANAAIGREYEDAVKGASTSDVCSDRRFDCFVWRLQKSLGGLHIISKSVESMYKTREMLCTGELELSCACLVAGFAGEINDEFDLTCEVPASSSQELTSQQGEDDDEENSGNIGEMQGHVLADEPESDVPASSSLPLVSLTVHAKVLSTVRCRSTDYISLLAITPRFDPCHMGLIESNARDVSAEGHVHYAHNFDILKPHDAQEYAYLHHPTFMLKSLPRVLRNAELPLLGGEDGLVKRDKGLYMSVVGIVQSGAYDSTCVSGECERLNVSVAVPDKLIKLMDKEASLFEASVERDLDTVRAARNLESSVAIPANYLENAESGTGITRIVGADKEEQIREALRRGVPVEYLLGRAVFCGNVFEVTGDVMVPRRSSESLVHACIQELQGVMTMRAQDLSPSTGRVFLLDIGVGSGCLLLSCLTHLRAQGIDCAGVGIDICPKALSVAMRNAAALNLADCTLFLQHSFEDLADLIPALLANGPNSGVDVGALLRAGGFDAIVCNPPYSSMREARLSRSRITHEPTIALFAEGRDLAPNEEVSKSKAKKDPYRAFTTIVSALGRALQDRADGAPLLKTDGVFVLEFGHGQGGRVRGLFDRSGWLKYTKSIVDFNKLERGFVFKRRENDISASNETTPAMVPQNASTSVSITEGMSFSESTCN